jgi:hypothetical protein
VDDVRSTVRWLSADRVRAHLAGLPPAHGYRLTVKPLRYRDRPHLAAYTEFDARRITIQMPEPFLPFGEIVPYAAKRLPSKGMRFAWVSEGITLRQPREVLRFLWCHEWYHWYLKEVLGRKSHAETACDRFALRNYLRERVTVDDARDALRKPKIDFADNPDAGTVHEAPATPVRRQRAARASAFEALRLDV